MRILLDAGHGIDTPGKRSPDGVFREYLWNRDIAERVHALLDADGYDVDLVVTETNDIALKTRVRRINEVCSLHGAGNVLLISIHANAAGDGTKWMTAQGWSCYTTKGVTESDKVADALYKAFESEFSDRKIRRDFSDKDADWEEDFYLIKKASCPAVLLENFFYDNKEECAWMLKEESKARIARAICKGIISWTCSRL
jgi:N-acetylmuramoyl-L-alanine amidase